MVESKRTLTSKMAGEAIRRAMENRNTRWHVVPHGRGWAVRREGADRAAAVYAEKTKATDRAAKMARSAKSGQVLIHGRDGRIQSEHTYSRDSYSTKR